MSIHNWRDLFVILFETIYTLIQRVIIFTFKPPPPRPEISRNPHGRVAIIGAGLTGISSAAHAISHNFDVVIFESGDSVGGIWSHVNSTSGLQLNSILYRFHPAVLWSKFFPRRDEIIGEIARIWKEYQLESRTRFKTRVTKVTRHESSNDPNNLGHARWVINNGEDGIFDAIIVAVGTCGKPTMIGFEGQDKFRGKFVHSSQLDDVDVRGKSVVVIGSGASGVEAIEWAVENKARSAVILARDDKWIIPRNIVFDTLISAQPFGRQMPLSFIPETIIKRFHYRDLASLAPTSKGIYEGTPIVNDAFLDLVRNGKASYIRGDTLEIDPVGVRVNVRNDPYSKPKDHGTVQVIPADVIVLATGFKHPDVGYLPADLFPEGYDRPNLFLQNFSTEDWSVLMTNSAYQNAIGTVGHFHIGIYTRILLTFLLDKDARPIPKDMKLWVDAIRFVKRGARGGAFAFFTYMEMVVWVIAFHFFRPDRLRWMPFVLFGWGGSLRRC